MSQESRLSADESLQAAPWRMATARARPMPGRGSGGGLAGFVSLAVR